MNDGCWKPMEKDNYVVIKTSRFGSEWSNESQNLGILEIRKKKDVESGIRQPQIIQQRRMELYSPYQRQIQAWIDRRRDPEYQRRLADRRRESRQIKRDKETAQSIDLLRAHTEVSTENLRNKCSPFKTVIVDENNNNFYPDKEGDVHEWVGPFLESRWGSGWTQQYPQFCKKCGIFRSHAMQKEKLKILRSEHRISDNVYVIKYSPTGLLVLDMNKDDNDPNYRIPDIIYNFSRGLWVRTLESAYTLSDFHRTRTVTVVSPAMANLYVITILQRNKGFPYSEVGQADLKIILREPNIRHIFSTSKLDRKKIDIIDLDPYYNSRFYNHTAPMAKFKKKGEFSQAPEGYIPVKISVLLNSNQFPGWEGWSSTSSMDGYKAIFGAGDIRGLKELIPFYDDEAIFYRGGQSSFESSRFSKNPLHYSHASARGWYTGQTKIETKKNGEKETVPHGKGTWFETILINSDDEKKEVMRPFKALMYTGEWKNGKMDGKGTMIATFESLDVQQMKEFKDKPKNDVTLLRQIPKFKYEGNWKKGKRNGKGVETLYELKGRYEKLKGTYRRREYVGNFKDNQLFGEGKLTVYEEDGVTPIKVLEDRWVDAPHPFKGITLPVGKKKDNFLEGYLLPRDKYFDENGLRSEIRIDPISGKRNKNYKPPTKRR